MTFSDETLMAYADGELDPQTAAAVETAMRSDPQIVQRIAQHRALRGRLRAAFDPVLSETVPERLALARTTATPASNVAALRLRRPSPRWSWREWAAMAASFIVGALVVIPLMRGARIEPLAMRDGHLVANGVLASALSHQLASTQAAGDPVQIGVSFRSRAAQYCRSFTLREVAPLAGLACREGADWRVRALAPATPGGAGGEYRQAASPPAAVVTAIDAEIQGEALDAAHERAARDRAWQ